MMVNEFRMGARIEGFERPQAKSSPAKADVWVAVYRGGHWQRGKVSASSSTTHWLGWPREPLGLLAELIVANTARTAECYSIRETIEQKQDSTA
ncbi:MAG: hypothetical protein WKF77_06995 [Planctomycetaceae bacterium]